MDENTQAKVEAIRGRLLSGPSQSGRAETKDYDGPCRKSAQTMIRDRIALLRGEADRLDVLLKVFEAGTQQYGDGAAWAEEALWEILNYTNRARPW